MYFNKIEFKKRRVCGRARKKFTIFYSLGVVPQKRGEITVALFLADAGIGILHILRFRIRILVVVLGFEFALV
jgi:hypothetical protein